MVVVRMLVWFVMAHVVLMGHILYSLAMLAWYSAKGVWLRTCIMAARLYMYVRHGPEGLAGLDCQNGK